MKPRLITFFVLVAFAISPALAFADARDDALAINQEAQELYADGDYDAAAKKFQEAHAVFPVPQILLGEALSWYRAGECRRAVEAAERFQNDMPDASQTDRSDMLMVRAECEVITGQQLLASGDIAGAVVSADRAETIDRTDRASESIAALRADIEKAERAEQELAEENETQTEEPRLVAEVEQPGEPEQKRGIPVLGWVIVGTGAALGVVSVVTRQMAGSLIKVERDTDGKAVLEKEEDRTKYEGLKAANVATAIAGGVLGATGLAIILWPRSESSVAIGPGPGDVGGSVTFRF